MQEFKIGDIIRSIDDEATLYLVVDFHDFSALSITNIEYELMQIYPVYKQNHSKYLNLNQKEIVIHAEYGSKNNEMIHRFIKKDRERIGLFGLPDFLKVMAENIRYREIQEDEKPKKSDMVARFDLCETLDECLDSINDLNLLYKMFGNESHLQIKGMIIEYLKNLE